MKKVDYLLKLFNELIGLPVALLIYLVTPSLLRLIDPTSGEFDTGQLAVLSFGIIKVIMASLVAWAGYRLNLPVMYQYFIGPLETDLNAGNQTALVHLIKAGIHLLVYFLYMFLAMWAFQTV
jgi:hypothetical protein